MAVQNTKNTKVFVGVVDEICWHTVVYVYHAMIQYE